MNMYLTNFTLQRAKNQIVIKDVIVTGNDKLKLMSDPFYLKTALRRIDKQREAANYTVIDIQFIKQIGETSH